MTSSRIALFLILLILYILLATVPPFPVEHSRYWAL